MLGAITLLLVYQLLGEVAVQFLGLPVPGPVVGMLLLFVPAGVGVMLHFKRLGAEWLPIAVALVASTEICIGVTALVMQWLLRRQSASRTA